MTKAHTRDLSAVRPHGCGSIHSIKTISLQFSLELFQKFVGEVVA